MPLQYLSKALTFFPLYAVGVVKDLSFLIDILPAYLFPNDERVIGEWVLAGFSLGGHAAWLGLRHGAHTHLLPITPSHSDYRSLFD